MTAPTKLHGPIQIRRSSTAGAVPTNLLDGQPFWNAADEKLLIKNAAGTPVEVGSAAAAARTFGLTTVDITSIAIHTLPDPQGRADGEQTVVRFNGTNTAQGVCEVVTAGARPITYMTTGASFWTPGRGEIVRFIVSAGTYVAEIVQKGLPWEFAITGAGGWYAPAASWTLSNLTTVVGDAMYRRILNGEHASMPCHGVYSVKMVEFAKAGQSASGYIYVAAGSGSAVSAHGYVSETLPAAASAWQTTQFTKFLQRDVGVSQWLFGSGVELNAVHAALSITFVGR
jgi:hypothetical protein